MSSEGQKKIKAINASTSLGAIYKDDVKRILVPELDIKEQKQIAETLSGIDSLISKLQELIVKKKNIRQGTMQRVLTGKNRLQGFSSEWKDTTLGNICDIKDGTHQTPHYVESGIPFYSVETVTNDDFTHVKYISLEEHERLTSSYKIENGDVLMTRIGSIGKGKYVDWNPNASFYVSLALLKFRGNKPLANFIALLTGTEEFQKEAELHSLQFAIPMKINLGQIEFYHNLYVSECWQKKKGKIVKRLKENKLQPQVYVITLSQGEQNQLEFFSSVLLKQSIFEHSKLFVIGIADGYDEALFLVEEIVQDVYQETKSANARQFLLTDQAEYEKKGR